MPKQRDTSATMTLKEDSVITILYETAMESHEQIGLSGRRVCGSPLQKHHIAKPWFET